MIKIEFMEFEFIGRDFLMSKVKLWRKDRMDKKTVNKLIGKMDNKTLIKLIGEMAKHNSAAEQALLDFCEKNVTKDNKSLVLHKQIEKHWKNAYWIINSANDYGGCSDSDYEEASDDIDIILRIINENDIAWKIRNEVLDGMLEQIAYDNSGFTDFLVDVALELCQDENETEYLADFLAEKGNSYYKGVATSIYSQLGKNEKYLKNRKSNLEYGSDYIDLANYYKKNGKGMEAMRIAWEGFDKCTGRLDDIYRYLFNMYNEEGNESAIFNLYKKALKKKWNLDCITELMYDYYKGKNDYDNQKKMLRLMIQRCDNRYVLYWYEMCKEELESVDWKENEEEILLAVKDKNLSAYLDICVENGKMEEVLEGIQNEKIYNYWNSIDDGHKYSKILAEYYPDEVVGMYWREANWYINKGKEKNYRHAVSVLREIRAIMKKNNKTEEWKIKFLRLKMDHGRKRLLMKAMDDGKLG